MHRPAKLGRAFLLASLLVGCMEDQNQETYDDTAGAKPGTGVSTGTGLPYDADIVDIPVHVEFGAFGLIGSTPELTPDGLGLTATAATAYSITLDDDPVGDAGGASTCLSQYTATVTLADADIEVYKDDRDCLAKLTSLTTGGITYTSTDTGANQFHHLARQRYRDLCIQRWRPYQAKSDFSARLSYRRHRGCGLPLLGTARWYRRLRLFGS